MCNRQTAALALLVLFGVACAGNPAAPTVTAGRISAMGNLTQNGCAYETCSSFSFSIKNDGPGCVSTVDLRGVATITNSLNVQIAQADWELTLGEKIRGILRPGDTAAATGGRMTWFKETFFYRITVVQTNVPCS